MYVNLSSLLEGFFLQKNWNKSFLNQSSGEVITVALRSLEIAKKSNIEDLQDRLEKSEAIVARQILESEIFIPLPEITDSIYKNMLIEFVSGLKKNEALTVLSITELEKIIRESGKNTIWYSYHLSRIKKMITDWAFDNHIKIK